MIPLIVFAVTTSHEVVAILESTPPNNNDLKHHLSTTNHFLYPNLASFDSTPVLESIPKNYKKTFELANIELFKLYFSKFR